MRQPRLKAPKNLEFAYYHCVSRAVDRNLVFDETSKEEFVQFMRLYEKLCHVRVITYCVMPNHIHLLVEVPARPKAAPSEKTLLRHIADCHGEKYAEGVEESLRKFRAEGQKRAAAELLERWLDRLWDISSFMKTFKQRFTQWYNKTHNRRGTLWEERYRSTLVEGGSTALAMVGAYIDLNPMRAKLVKDSARYRWCGYGAATAGDKTALQGIETLVAFAGKTFKGTRSLEKYRQLMAGHFDSKSQPRKPVIVAPAKGNGKKNSAAKKDLSVGEALRQRIRYFSSGAAVGSREFVNKIFSLERSRFGLKRKEGARPMKGADFGNLFTLKELRNG